MKSFISNLPYVCEQKHYFEQVDKAGEVLPVTGGRHQRWTAFMTDFGLSLFIVRNVGSRRVQILLRFKILFMHIRYGPLTQEATTYFVR